MDAWIGLLKTTSIEATDCAVVPDGTLTRPVIAGGVTSMTTV